MTHNDVDDGQRFGGADVTTLLRDAADAELGDLSLDHPVLQPVAGSATRGRSRSMGLAVLAVAAAVMLIAGVVWRASGDSSVDVAAPADPQPEPGSGAAAAGSPDVSDPAAVVAAAVERTQGTSWEATVTSSNSPGDAQRITHLPLGTDGLGPYDAYRVSSGPGVPEIVALSDSPAVVALCAQDHPEPCQPGASLDILNPLIDSQIDVDPTAGPSDDVTVERARLDRQLVGFTAVSITGPALQDGIYPVEGDADICRGVDRCSGTLHIADGYVVRLELAGPGASTTWEYGSFGIAETFVEPSPEDIVALLSNSLACSEVRTEPGADEPGLDAWIRGLLEAHNAEANADAQEQVKSAPDADAVESRAGAEC